MQQVVCDHMAVSKAWPQTTTNFATKTELESKNGNSSVTQLLTGFPEFIQTGLMSCQSVLFAEGSHPAKNHGIMRV